MVRSRVIVSFALLAGKILLLAH
eukprot:COSAG02_NODE_74483_length_158_cov_3.067797_1_plen_22_part_01